MTLFLFYFVTVTDILVRIYSAVWVIPNTRDVTYLGVFLPLMNKFVLGFLQFWTMTELAMRVKQCVIALEVTFQTDGIDHSSKYAKMARVDIVTERKILCLRISCVVTIVLVFAATIFRYIQMSGKDGITSMNRFSQEMSALSVFVIILIVSSLAALLYQMVRKEKLMNDRLNEKCEVF